MEIVAVLVGVLGLVYLISCGLHPYKRCLQCQGTGRHYGAVFTQNSRLCTRCGGRNRIRRGGSHVMNSGQTDLKRPWIQGPD